MWISSALLLCGLGVAAFGQVLPGPVTVFFDSDQAMPAAVLSALQGEADAVVLPSSIRLSWRSGKPHEHTEVVQRLAVVRLRGICSVDAPLRMKPAANLHGEALGQTQTVNGSVLPFADIQCDAVRQFVASELKGRAVAEQEEMLGRALGRVIAHELYHMLLRTKEHGREGLARPMISRAELVRPRQTFAPADEARLSAGAPATSADEESGR